MTLADTGGRPSRARQGLLVFLLLGFGLPWAGWTVLKDLGLPFWLLPLGCSLAAFAASLAEGGIAQLRAFSRRVLSVRLQLRVIAFALLLPISLGLLLLGLRGVPAAYFDPNFKPSLWAMLAMGLVTGPLAEEFGWRGYLQNRLLQTLRPITVALLTGGLWCLWHLPLFQHSVFAAWPSTLHFAAFCLTWSVFLLFVVARSGGTVWPAVLLHAAINAHSSLLGMLFPALDRAQLPGGSQSTLFYAGAALAFVAWQRRFFFGRPVPA